jgi:hypothetical protein
MNSIIQCISNTVPLGKNEEVIISRNGSTVDIMSCPIGNPFHVNFSFIFNHKRTEKMGGK